MRPKTALIEFHVPLDFTRGIAFLCAAVVALAASVSGSDDSTGDESEPPPRKVRRFRPQLEAVSKPSRDFMKKPREHDGPVWVVMRGRAHRPLTLEETTRLLRAAHELHRNRDAGFHPGHPQRVRRIEAAQELVRFEQLYCIPALLAVVRDRNEPDDGLRKFAFSSLVRIKDRVVIDLLIEMLEYPDEPKMSFFQMADSALAGIAKWSPDDNWYKLPPKERTGEARQKRVAEWQAWWNANYSRPYVLPEHQP